MPSINSLVDDIEHSCSGLRNTYEGLAEQISELEAENDSLIREAEELQNENRELRQEHSGDENFISTRELVKENEKLKQLVIQLTERLEKKIG